MNRYSDNNYHFNWLHGSSRALILFLSLSFTHKHIERCDAVCVHWMCMEISSNSYNDNVHPKGRKKKHSAQQQQIVAGAAETFRRSLLQVIVFLSLSPAHQTFSLPRKYLNIHTRTHSLSLFLSHTHIQTNATCECIFFEFILCFVCVLRNSLSLSHFAIEFQMMSLHSCFICSKCSK